MSDDRPMVGAHSLFRIVQMMDEIRRENHCDEAICAYEGNCVCFDELRDAQKSAPEGWRTVCTLTLLASQSGLVALNADDPRNLSISGRSLEEAFRQLITFITQCADLGQPFEVLEGIKIKDDQP